MQGLVFGERYLLEKKIGSGAFGEIWEAMDTRTNTKVAVKFEDVDMKKQQLYSECWIYMTLLAKDRGDNRMIPWVHHYHSQSGKNYMVMDLLGDSLESLLKKCGGKFSIKTTCMIGLQMLDIIEFIHDNWCIHRDIKPDNIMTGYDKRDHWIYLVDFGLSKKYMNWFKEHITFWEGKGLTGTAWYVSLNTHEGLEQSWRDDIETLGYVLIYFLKGKLNWQGLKTKNGQGKYDEIFKIKKSINMSELC